MTARRYRTVPSSEAGYGPGNWVVQYFDASMGIWFDLGDPVTTRLMADVKIAAAEAADRG